MIKVRINNIECRFSQGRYEIVKFQPNQYYQKQEEYIADGWKLEGGFFRKNRTSISSSLFNLPETCYTIVTLKYNRGEGCCDMTTVGNRLLELDKNDRDIFFKVYELAEKMIFEEEEKEDEEY